MPSATERHYTVPEIAKNWHLNEGVVRRLFSEAMGVIQVGTGSRTYLRIPESVLQRVHRERMKGSI
jgi:hypothetical protein